MRSLEGSMMPVLARTVTRRTLFAGSLGLAAGFAALRPEALPIANAARISVITPRLCDRARFGVTGSLTGAAPLDGVLHATEKEIGCSFPVVGVFYSFETIWANHLPSLSDLARIPGRVLNVAWMPSKTASTVLLTDIPKGKYDVHIDQMLAGMRAYPGPVVVRFGHEMNGNWYPWSVAYPTTKPFKGCFAASEYIAAFRYIAQRARSQASSNVRFAFTINESDAGTIKTPAKAYYPGDDVVDVLAFDAYNGYSTSWKDPNKTWLRGYTTVTACTTKQCPVEIHETGCAEPYAGQRDPVTGKLASKAVWAHQMAAQTGFDRLSTVLYFASKGGRDWRFETTPIALAGFASTYDAVNSSALTSGQGVLPYEP